MATKDKLPSNEAIWSGRRVAVPKAPKVKPTRKVRNKGKGRR
jgi:hypothetical protein